MTLLARKLVDSRHATPVLIDKGVEKRDVKKDSTGCSGECFSRTLDTNNMRAGTIPLREYRAINTENIAMNVASNVKLSSPQASARSLSDVTIH